MNIATLIHKLQALQESVGNVEVEIQVKMDGDICPDYYAYRDIIDIEFEPKENKVVLNGDISE
jgi:hypothetical protein